MDENQIQTINDELILKAYPDLLHKSILLQDETRFIEEQVRNAETNPTPTSKFTTPRLKQALKVLPQPWEPKFITARTDLLRILDQTGKVEIDEFELQDPPPHTGELYVDLTERPTALINNERIENPRLEITTIEQLNTLKHIYYMYLNSKTGITDLSNEFGNLPNDKPFEHLTYLARKYFGIRLEYTQAEDNWRQIIYRINRDDLTRLPGTNTMQKLIESVESSMFDGFEPDEVNIIYSMHALGEIDLNDPAMTGFSQASLEKTVNKLQAKGVEIKTVQSKHGQKPKYIWTNSTIRPKQ